MFKKTISAVSSMAFVLSMLILPSSALAANSLQCFADTPGTCSIISGVATLNNTSGGDSGVYTAVSSLSGKTLAQVDQLSFTYTGTPTAGSPRISLPIDTTGDGTRDGYAFIGSNLCNDGSNLVNAITNATCDVNYLSVDYTNWAAFIAAFPSAKVGPGVSFVIADDAGIWTVSNIHLGSIVADNVVTNPADGITSTGATVHGTNGPSLATDTSFWLGTTLGGPFVASVTPGSQLPGSGGWYGVDSGSQSVNAPFSYAYIGLTPNTTYYFVAWSLVGGTWYPGDVLSFTTSTVTPPVTTLTNKDQCKDNGYKSFTNPGFKNQGQCVSYVQANEHAGKKVK